MRPFFILLFLYAGQLTAQLSCLPEDKLLFGQKMESIQQISGSTFGDTLVQIGKSFLKTPYVEKTLEIGDSETLVINLRGLDCTTFVENVLAFSQLLRKRDHSFEDYANQLKTIRYRNGILDGYSSRLHYFTEWILNNNEKGFVTDITADLGGVELQKSIDFMGTHRDLYPFLSEDRNFQRIREIESELAKQKLCYLPQNEIAAQEHLIKNGDIIALATSIKGLDVTHTGLALKKNDGSLHLLHASISGEVTITEQPLVDYLKKIKSNIGIIVARPQ